MDPVVDSQADRLELVGRVLVAAVVGAMLLIVAGLYGARSGENWAGPVALTGAGSLLALVAVGIPLGRRTRTARTAVGHPVPPSLANLVHGAHLAYELLGELAKTARVPWYRRFRMRKARREVRQNWGFLLHALATAERARRRGDVDGYERHCEKASARAMGLIGLADQLTSTGDEDPSAG